MSWTLVCIALSSVFSVILVLKLVTLNLQRVYLVFTCFLIFEVISISALFIQLFLAHHFALDYRIFWLATRAVSWTLEIWVVLALLQAILASLPGVLNLSKRVLAYVFGTALLLTLISARSEYRAAGGFEYTRILEQAVSVGLVLERVFASIALLVLVAMLLFILSFPVKMPRNLAAFSIGFVFYLTAKTTFLLFRSYLAHADFTLVENGTNLVLCGCLLYWIASINLAGETVPVTLGLRWHSNDQVRLLGHLETLNAALLRSARR